MQVTRKAFDPEDLKFSDKNGFSFESTEAMDCGGFRVFRVCLISCILRLPL